MNNAFEYMVFLNELGISEIPETILSAVDEAEDTVESPADEHVAVQDAPQPEGQVDTVDGVARLEEMREQVASCTACRLCEKRTQAVFGEGNPHTDLMFIGEGPGYDEDQQGMPFVGKAGQLLTRIINAIDLKREDVYITNVVKCRPPQNRDPLPEEVSACWRYVEEQIRLIRPRVICTLGRHATQTVLKTGDSISKLRGQFIRTNNIMVMPTYHPAYLLRNPGAKRDVWMDVQKIRDYLKENSNLYER